MVQRVVLIHGPPACGKLTTARALAPLIGGVILHNHLTYNLAHTLFEIGDPRLVVLHRELRMVMLRHALSEGMPDLILTLVYAEPDSEANLADIGALVAARGALLLPVYLQCPERELYARVTGEDRIASGKLSSPSRLKTLLEQGRHPPLPHPRTRIVDNGNRDAAEVAKEIADWLRSVDPSGS
ncbi:MAG: hypothetical protein AB7I04_13745 [Pseudomonadales bacterium]